MIMSSFCASLVYENEDIELIPKFTEKGSIRE